MLKKKEKATTINELYNIPCCNGIPILSTPLIDEMASFPKRKRKRRCEWKCCQRKKEATIRAVEIEVFHWNKVC